MEQTSLNKKSVIIDNNVNHYRVNKNRIKEVF